MMASPDRPTNSRPSLCLVLLLLLGRTKGQADWPQQWFRNSSAGCYGRAVGAECAELNDFFTFVQDGGYFWGAPHTDASGSNDVRHQACDNTGTVFRGVDHDGQGDNLGTQQCGYATFRLSCTATADVNFRAEMAYANDGRGPNDDSFWTGIDGDRSSERIWTNIPRMPTWGGAPPAFERNMRLEAGVHTFNVAEREDGTALRRVMMVAGYPDCMFGEQPLNAGDVLARVIELETQTNDRVSALQSTVSALQSNLTQAQTEASTAVAVMAAMSTQVATSVASQIAAFRAELQTQNTAEESRAAALSDRVGAIESRMVGQAAVPAFAVGASGPGAGTPSITAVGPNLKLAAAGGGDVKVTGGGCFEADLCGLAQTVQAITEALRQS